MPEVTLITGGAGFIGSRLARQLIERGERVVLLDNFDPYYAPALKRANLADLGSVPLVEGDIRDSEVVERVFLEHGVTRVAHMAAMSGVRYSAEHGALYASVNTMGSVILMDAARKHGARVFVQSSTSTIYGHTNRVPFVESDPAAAPLSPYSASKRAAELFGYTYHQLHGMNVTVLRFFNVYGPHGRPDMMPIRVLDAILNDKPITAYNGGTLKRDWTYIDDIVDGVIAALERPQGYAIFNLGFGAPLTLLEFIHIYEELTGKQAITVDVPAPKTEPLITYCDNTLARERLGFNPRVDIREGLARTYAWYRRTRG